MERQATCACGRLRVRCQGEPVKVSLCHCSQCQRRTGSTYGIAAFYARSALTVEGEVTRFVRASDGGHEVAFHFCPACGSTVYWEPSRKPELMAVAVGAFADPSFPAPTQAVHDDMRHPWVHLP
jgi:hypothetical protein